MSAELSGFVCPNCMKQLASFDALVAHANKGKCTASTLSKGSSTLLSRFASRFQRPDGQAASEQEFSEDHQQRVVSFPPQERGVVVDKTSNFRKARSQRKESTAIEESRLISRLEKLLFKGPQGNRKDYERSVVPWMDGKLVPKCPDCGRGFGLRRRQHHCRLCGSVLCDKCSVALDADAAVVLTVPPAVSGVQGQEREQQLAQRLKDKLVISGEELRICPYCFETLHRSRVKKVFQKKNPDEDAVMQLLKHVRAAMDVVTAELPNLNRDIEFMTERGDVTLYSSVARQRDVIRGKLNVIEQASRKIRDMVPKDQIAKYPSTTRMNQNIFLFSKDFLQLKTMGMMSLPPLAKIEAKAEALMQEEKQRRQREAAERQRAEQEQARAKQASSPRAAASARTDREPESSSTLDLLEEQRAALMQYLQAAKKAKKKDEVAMLKQQLADLDAFRSELSSSA